MLEIYLTLYLEDLVYTLNFNSTDSHDNELKYMIIKYKLNTKYEESIYYFINLYFCYQLCRI